MDRLPHHRWREGGPSARFRVYGSRSNAGRDDGAWHAGWHVLFSTLDSLTEEDLNRTVYIRGQAHSVLQATQRPLAHIACHVGQIVFLSKHLCGSNWKTLSIARGKSEEFTRAFGGKEAAKT